MVQLVQVMLTLAAAITLGTMLVLIALGCARSADDGDDETGEGRSPSAEHFGNLDVSNYSRVLGKCAGLLGCLLLSACQTGGKDVEPRALTKGNYMPLCLAFCQITTALTSHEGNYGEGITSTYTGGTASGSQTKGQ